MSSSKPTPAKAAATAALGTKSVGRLLLSYGLQTTASVGLFGFYSLSNAWFVSHGVNETALAAVNVVAPLLLLLGAVSSTVGAGGAALVSLSLGRKDSAGASRAAGNSFVVFWIAAILVTILGLVFLDPLLDLLGAHGEVRVYAHDYAKILLLGSIVSTGFSSLVRAEGRIRFSTMLWVVPVIVHIIMDPLLIFVFDLGVTGAALGTISGQLVSAVMSFWFFFVQKDRAYPITATDLRPHRAKIQRIVGIGAPTFLAGLGATTLTVLINNYIGSYGALAAAALAGFAVATRLQTFMVMPLTGIAQALAPIVAFNTGAGKRDRVAHTRNLSLVTAVVYGGVATGAVVLCAPWLASFFVTDTTTQKIATHALTIISLSFVSAGVSPIVSAYFQSIGQPKSSYLLSIGTLVGLKIPLVLLLGSQGLTALWWSIPIGELLAAVIAFLLLAAHKQKITLVST